MVIIILFNNTFRKLLFLLKLLIKLQIIDHQIKYSLQCQRLVKVIISASLKYFFKINLNSPTRQLNLRCTTQTRHALSPPLLSILICFLITADSRTNDLLRQTPSHTVNK